LKEHIFTDCLRHQQESNGKPFWNELLEKYRNDGFTNAEQLRSQFRKEKKRRGMVDNNMSQDNYRETIEVKSDGSISSDKLIMICEEDLKIPFRLLELHNFDPEAWELTYAKNNMWHMQQKGGTRLLCYQSKITAKPRRIPELSKETIDKIFENLDGREFAPVGLMQVSNSGKSLIVAMSDFHLGLFATDKTTGNDYNIEIAEQMYLSALNQIKDRVSNSSFEEVVFLVGNDWMNSDNLNNTTTAGTPQDSSDFWFELIDKSIELIAIGVNTLLEIAPVKVYNIVSNHDEHSMYSIMKTIEVMYKNNENVVVDTSPLSRKYYRFGKNLIGFSHDLNKNRALEIMSMETKQYWAECEHFYYFLAHLHTAMTYEKKGVLEIYRTPTISGFSRWSSKKGFVQSERKMQCFVLDKEDGITDVMNILVK